MFRWLKRKRHNKIWPIEAISNKSFLEDQYIDKLMNEGDQNKMYVAIGLTSLGVGFSEVESFHKVNNFKSLIGTTNPDILAFELTLFFIYQCYIYMEKLILDDDHYFNSEDLTETVSTNLIQAAHFITHLYSKHYEQQAVEKIQKRAFSEYVLKKEMAHEVLAKRILNCIGKKDFDSKGKVQIELQIQILIGVHAMVTYTTMIPAYIKSLNLVLEKFINFEIPEIG